MRKAFVGSLIGLLAASGCSGARVAPPAPGADAIVLVLSEPPPRMQ